MPRKPEHTQNSGTEREDRKEIQRIPLDQIDVPHHRERAPAAFQALVTNIRNLGLLHPIKVTREENGRYVLVFGEGRLEAFRALGYGEILAEVAEGMTSQEILLEWLTENLQRVEMSMRDKALNIKRMIEEYGFTQTQIAERLGLTQGYISRLYTVARYGSPKLQEALDKGKIGTVGAIVAKVKDQEVQDELFDWMERGEARTQAEGLSLVKRLPKNPRRGDLYVAMEAIRKEIKMYRELVLVANSRWARLIPNLERLAQDKEFLEFVGSLSIKFRWSNASSTP